MHPLANLLLFLLLIPAPTQAGNEPRTVILIGAASSKKSVMARCYPGIRVIPQSEAPEVWPQIVEEMRQHPERKYVIAGHSTSAVYAEHVGRKTNHPENLKLVLLDGYGDNGVQNRVETHCWYAKGANGESLNSSSMKNNKSGACNQSKSHTHILHDQHCRTQWCLHFSLVNRNDPEDLTDWRTFGYEDCKPFLDWIEQ